MDQHSDQQLDFDFVKRCVEMVLDAAGLRPSFYLVAPSAETHGPACALFADLPPTSPGFARLLARSIDGQLRNDRSYADLRAVGEYETLKIFAIDRSRCEPSEAFCAELQRRGQGPRPIGAGVCDTSPGWELVFPGDYVA
jgi:hypothetical protein